MPFLVLGLGLLMAAAGLSFMAIGWPVIQVERGWSMVIAGATMLAGGLVTAALALVLRAIERLPFKADKGERSQTDLAPVTVTEPKLSLDDLPPAVPVEPAEPKEALEPAVPVEAPIVAHETGATDRPHPVRRMPGPKVFDVPPPPPAPAPLVGKTEEPVEEAKATEPELSPPIDDWLDRDTRDLDTHHDDPVEAPTQPEIPPLAPAEDPEPTPPPAAVVGRYEADGTSYVMYADGSIEAQSPAGVYRFSSMAELKAFIEG